MKSFRDLNVYKESKRLAVEIHGVSLLLPKHELYEEGSQIRRSSKAVTSAIVEGYGRRRYKAEFIRFLLIQNVMKLLCIWIFCLKQNHLGMKRNTKY